MSDFQRQTDPEAAPGPPVKGDAVSTLMDVSERFMLKGGVISRQRYVAEHSSLKYLCVGIAEICHMKWSDSQKMLFVA